MLDRTDIVPPSAVTVVVSTFNRATPLERALAALAEQTRSTPPFDVIVVDNNSNDGTPQVVERFQRRFERVRYVFEPRQGLSYARNAGIAAATAPIVAFTDDDVCVGSTWVSSVHQALSAHPDIAGAGGRTLPLWPFPPPPWLTTEHWVGPLALQDYGTASFIVDAKRPICLAGANLAFRKSVFSRVGLFDTAFVRAQDTEFLLRMYRAGERALYVPDMLVQAPVDPERMTKAYHRRWHLNIGRCNTRMAFQELSDPVLGLRPEPAEFSRAFGIPLFAFRQFAGEFAEWIHTSLRGTPADAFGHETRLWELLGYVLESRAGRRSKRSGATGVKPRVGLTMPRALR
ncbi:MAG: glycosyltransferase family 2 protein [Vicinamibacterales bacterium]